MKFLSENRVIIGIGLFVLLIVISWPFILYLFLDSSEIASSERGQFGDMYGALNSLFSGLTIVGLIYTIIIQHDEITELKRNSKLERFENIFFKTLEMYNISARELRIKLNETDKSEQVGKEFFELLITKGLTEEKFIETVKNDEMITEVINPEEYLDNKYIFRNFYGSVYKFNAAYLDQYFNIIEQVLQSIEDFIGSKDEKIRYISIFRSQLTSYEKALIGFHILGTMLHHSSLKSLTFKHKLLDSDVWFLSGFFTTFYTKKLQTAFHN